MTEVPHRNVETILMYSPDMDFCASLKMLLQDKYNMGTTTDPELLLMMVKTLRPDLVIVDALPTERMRQRFEAMRLLDPHLRIMLFYVSRIDRRIPHDSFLKCVDAAFSKPLDLMEVSRSIDRLVSATC